MLEDQVPTGTADIDVPLNQTAFFNSIIRSLSGTLETTVGLEDAEAFITTVGAELSDQIGEDYARALGRNKHNIQQLADVLVDLKARIGGKFRLVSISEDEIILANAECPFGDKVAARPSLCMMTTTVFGRLVAESNGYARVKIDEAIATGASQCLVRISLRPGAADDGYEFFC